jgi:hypothetical protein
MVHNKAVSNWNDVDAVEAIFFENWTATHATTNVPK